MDEALQMPPIMALNNRKTFKEKLEATRITATNELKTKLETKKIEVILQKFKENNLSFNFSGSTLKDLKNQVQHI